MKVEQPPQTPGTSPEQRGAGTSAPDGPARWRRWWPLWLNRDLALLFTGRGLRSLAQGYLAIIVPLYLARLGFDGVHLGIVFSASALASALLAAGVGLLSDRFGRKTFLILISLMMAGGGLVFALSHNFIVLVIAGALGTIGRGGGAGSGGGWGPYYPAEQALIAEHTSDRLRTTIFGALSFVGVLAGALGSLVAAAPLVPNSRLADYRVLFFLTIAIGVAMALVVIPVRERGGARPAPGNVSPSPRPPQAPIPAQSAQRKMLGISAFSWNYLWRFMVTNLTNGLAVGMLGPILVYWFYRRYGVGSAEIGTLFFLINLAAALPYLLAGRLARRLGAVNTIVFTRGVSVVLLFLMAVMPTYALAGAIYLVRMCFNTLSIPVRQSYVMGVIPREERASAAGLSNLPSQAAAAIGPTFAGYLIQQVAVDLPLELAALFQGLNAVLYYFFFRHIRPPEEREPHEPRESTEQAR